MGKFKGTQGKWEIDFPIGNFKEDCYWERIKVNDNTIIETKGIHYDIPNIEAKYNNLLISKAPEMLEMLVECKNILDQHCGLDVTKIEQLIKESTEL